jgi:hypothetical protein
MTDDQLSEHVVSIFQGEVHNQAEFVTMAILDLDEMIKQLGPGFDHDRFWFTMDAALGAIARLGDIFWPRDKESRSKRRGRILRERFGIEAADEATKRDVRNSFEHFAQRLDSWAETSEHGMFIDRNIGPAGALVNVPVSYARHYDPRTHVISVFGQELNLRDAYRECVDLVAQVPKS